MLCGAMGFRLRSCSGRTSRDGKGLPDAFWCWIRDHGAITSRTRTSTGLRRLTSNGHSGMLGVRIALSKVPKRSMRATAGEVVVMLLVLTIAASMVWPILFTDWIASDDGGMAQIAERVLRGQLPHRDFDDPWTGGWSFFQAAVFHIWGLSIDLLRVPIFVAWLAGLLLAFRVARRFVSVPVAALSTITAAAWSLYSWHLPLPNWYYAPLALLSCWAIVRFEESGRSRWLVLAGIGAGVSLSVKVSGFYLLAALMLWALVRAGERSGPDSQDRGRGFAAVAALLLAAFVSAVLLLLLGLPREIFGAASLHFLLPCVGIAAGTLRRVWHGQRTARTAVFDLAVLLGPILVGLLLAVAPILWHYARADALHDLFLGVFVRPQVRMTRMVFGPSGRLATLAALVPLLLLLAASRFATWPGTRRAVIAAAALGACWGVVSLYSPEADATLALSLRALPILLPFLAFGWDHLEANPTARGRVSFLLVASATTAQLVQVPWAWHNYFLFTAPLVVLATWALIAHVVKAATGVLVFWGVFLVVAAIAPRLSAPARRFHALPLDRGGLQVSLLDSVRWGRLDEAVRALPGGPILVLGDAPEVPFLLGRESAGRAIYDRISDSVSRDTAQMMALLQRGGVQTVIIRHVSSDQDSLISQRLEILRREFHETRMLWPFEVRWRVQPPAGIMASGRQLTSSSRPRRPASEAAGSRESGKPKHR